VTRKLCLIITIALCLLSACGPVSVMPPEPAAPKERAGTVSFEVSAKNAVNWGKDGLPEDGGLFPAQSVPLLEGDSVLDILIRTLPDTENRSGYVAGILGLREKDCGAASGWYYYVNGEAPLMSAAKYYPADGDVIRFLFTVKAGDIPY